MRRFWTADNHFNHRNVIHFCNRPFKNVWNMNAFMIGQWNAKVGPKDLTYILGDFYWKELYGEIGFKELMKKLNGKKILIIGSHDRISLRYPCLFEEITPQKEIKIDGNHVILNHYCMRVWPRSHYNSWHLYGHSHGRLAPVGKSLDVGVDCHGFTPWSEKEIVQYMEVRPDNFNYVNRREQ